MEYLIGAALALGVGVFATLSGFDRDRSFYAVVLVVIAGLYNLFAAMGGSAHASVIEAMIGAGFIAVAVIGFRTNLWLVAGGLAAHGIFDFFHGGLISNPGVPLWWPMFCLTYDVVAAAYLAFLLSYPEKSGLHTTRMRSA